MTTEKLKSSFLACNLVESFYHPESTLSRLTIHADGHTSAYALDEDDITIREAEGGSVTISVGVDHTWSDKSWSVEGLTKLI